MWVLLLFINKEFNRTKKINKGEKKILDTEKEKLRKLKKESLRVNLWIKISNNPWKANTVEYQKNEFQKKPTNGVNLDSKRGLVSETERDRQCK